MKPLTTVVDGDMIRHELPDGRVNVIHAGEPLQAAYVYPNKQCPSCGGFCGRPGGVCGYGQPLILNSSQGSATSDGAEKANVTI